jgi:cell elongation specific D,D-transpeptidase
MAKRFLDKYLEVEKGIEVVKKTPQTETKQVNTSTTQRNVNNNNSEQGRGEETVNEE